MVFRIKVLLEKLFFSPWFLFKYTSHNSTYRGLVCKTNSPCSLTVEKRLQNIGNITYILSSVLVSVFVFIIIIIHICLLYLKIFDKCLSSISLLLHYIGYIYNYIGYIHNILFIFSSSLYTLCWCYFNLQHKTFLGRGIVLSLYKKKRGLYKKKRVRGSFLLV